jgi:hypothetical protein
MLQCAYGRDRWLRLPIAVISLARLNRIRAFVDDVKGDQKTGPENREGQVLTCPDACMCSAENQPASEPAEISLPHVSSDGENSRLVNVRLW